MRHVTDEGMGMIRNAIQATEDRGHTSLLIHSGSFLLYTTWDPSRVAEVAALLTGATSEMQGIEAPVAPVTLLHDDAPPAPTPQPEPAKAPTNTARNRKRQPARKPAR